MKFFLFLFLTLFLHISYVFSDMKFMLYGFKLAQTTNQMIAELGMPHEIYDFNDGFVAYIYKFEDHGVAFEIHASQPELIYSIQIQGISNSQHYGLEGVNLGDSVDKALKLLGRPDNKKNAVDLITQKEKKGVIFYSYNQTANYSFEAISNKVISIKILYRGPETKLGEARDAFNGFLKAIKDKNYYKVASYLTPSTVIYWDGEHKIDRSVLSYILKNSKIYDIFFNSKTGIASFDIKDVKESALRISDAWTAMVFKIIKNKKKYEIVFIRSFDGWVISYIDKFD